MIIFEARLLTSEREASVGLMKLYFFVILKYLSNTRNLFLACSMFNNAVNPVQSTGSEWCVLWVDIMITKLIVVRQESRHKGASSITSYHTWYLVLKVRFNDLEFLNELRIKGFTRSLLMRMILRETNTFWRPSQLVS